MKLKSSLLCAGLVLAGIGALVGTVNAAPQIPEGQEHWSDGSRSCAGATGSVFTLVQVANSNDPDPINTSSADKISVVNVPKAATSFPYTLSTASGSKSCALLDDGSGLPDTNYPTNATWSGTFTIAVKYAGDAPSRIPLGQFMKGYTPKPGDKFQTVDLAQSQASTPCTLYDGSNNTNYFYKICLNANTNVRAAQLP